ncbi:zinc-dependent alcohol dehydrogenase family protein [Georgenia yuyongxinii]|uniref:Zinc-dependent alcohol dehydrogenase family protein n=1 Tax=Georgenia yuyongxinii TaxID=2589797 RepID=A0A5B8C7A7_9MICO|nr:zinc-dependent alcohol dehydrogenase family protein [Georgenia yuyongxinii]QDC26334.1 zinc-dependent alcohol dehydrogenase family protein [Georgenia yuyongxinii]
MRATTIYGPGDIRLEEAPDPTVRQPGDAVVRVTAACVCGSDLWRYRGVVPTRKPTRIGHEFVGVVEEVGAEVRSLAPGDFVIAPFAYSCGECVSCRHGIQTSCERGGYWGGPDRDGLPVDGGQGEYVRVPLADGTLVGVPEVPDDDLLPSLLTLTDVMGTGHHAALRGGAGPGRTVAVVGDGAVGLCAVLAARRLGAERVVIFSRHPDRQAVARQFGADDVIAARGEDGVGELRDLLGAPGADVVLEAVGNQDAMEQAIAAARPGGNVGYVGVPNGISHLSLRPLFNRNVNLLGGVAPVRAYLEELLADVLDGTIAPWRVFDSTMPLDDVAAAYAAMDDRTAIKVMLRR